MISNPKIIAKMLVYAYRAEFDEAEVIFRLLPEIPSGEDWEILITMFKDNLIHMDMLEKVLNDMGYEVPEISPRNFPQVSDRNQALELIAKFEKAAYNYYCYLLKNTDFSRIDNGGNIQNTLKNLVEWERRHIEMIKKTLDNFKVRYKIL